MNLLDQATKVMLDNLIKLPEGEFGELYNLEQHLEPVNIGEFMEPEPDTVEDDVPLEMLMGKRSILGCYYSMRSPGKVVLFTGNLKRFFNGLLREVLKVTPYVTKNDLTAAARLVVIKTWQHELFHFDCNVLRIMFGVQQDSIKEEALAVAWSRMKIAEEHKVWNTSIGRMSGVVYGVLMDKAFQYRSPGYRDWHLFGDEASFKAGLLDYLHPPQKAFLVQSGVPLPELVYAMLGKGKDGQGFIEMAV